MPATTPTKPNSFAVSQALAFATVLLWSTSYVFTKVTLGYFSAASLGLFRCAIASLCLAVIAVSKGIALPKLKDIPLFIISGASGFGVYLIVFNIGTSFLSPTTSCILISLSPIITSVLAVVLFKEPLNGLRWLATGISFCGILAMCLWEGTFQVSEGILWMLVATLLISIYNLMQRWLSYRYNAIQITSYSFFAGTIMLLWCAPDAFAQAQAAPLAQIMLVIFLGVFPSAMAYLLWVKALALTPKISNVTNYMFLTPFLALLLEYAVFGSFPGTATFVGGGIILLGLALFNFSEKIQNRCRNNKVASQLGKSHN